MKTLLAFVPWWIWLVVAGALLGAYEYRVYAAQETGAKRQKLLDDAAIAKRDERIGTLEATLSTSQGDLKACQLAAGKQNEGIDAVRKQSAAALAASNAEKVKAQIKAAEHAQEVRRLQGIAAAPPKVDQSCTEALGLTDKIQRDSARERRK